MAVFGPRMREEWHEAAELSGGAVVAGNGVILDPKDRSPNRNWREVSEDGTPRAWGIDLPPGREAQHAYASRPGMRPASPTTPDEEETPNQPRQATLARQTGEGVPVGISWAAFKSLVSGWQPNRDPEDASRLPAAGTPSVEAIPVDRRGLPDDSYGVRTDLRMRKNGDRTLPSGFTVIPASEFEAGKGIRVYVPPEAASSVATHVGAYVTRPLAGGRAGTEREQAVANLAEAAARGYFDIPGPYDDNGRRPATRDESGLGSPPAPLRRRRNGRAWVDERRSDFDLQAGIYMIGFKRWNGRGYSIISDLTDRIVVEGDWEKVRRRLRDDEDPAEGETLETDAEGRHGVRRVQLPYKKNTALWFFFPGLTEGDRIQIWVYREPLTQGAATWSTVYRGKSPRGGEHDYGADKLDPGEARRDPGIPIHGYAPDAEPRGLRDRMVDAGAPGREDTSGIPGPDPGSGPECHAVGPGLPDAPATYWCGASDEDDLGNETLPSPAVKQRIAEAQTLLISPALVTNRLRNAEGSERAGDGTVFGWTGLGTGPTSRARFEDGSLILEATSTGTSLAPTSGFVAIPDEEADVTVLGRLRVTRYTSGTDATRYVLRFYDDENAQVGADRILLEMASAGQLSLGDGGATFGPSGTPKPDGATRARVFATGAGANWNSAARIENMAVFVYPAALRKFESLGPGQPANFAPRPAVGFPHSSAHALGPVPQAETAAPAAEPLVEEVTFEGGAWPASWSALGSNNLGDVVELVGVFGSYSQRIQDDSTNNVKQHLRRRIYSDAQLGNSPNLHFRFYDTNPRLPTKGEALRARINDGSGVTMGSVWYTPTGAKLYRHKANGDRDVGVVVLSGLSNDVPVDAEIGVTNGGTKNGAVTFSGGTGGNPRTALDSHTSRDFAGRMPRQIDFGLRETTAGQKATMRADNLLVSKNGAPLDYEAPAAPSGTTIPAAPPAPDAPPLASGSHRLFDFLNDPLNQWWWFIEPGIPKAEGQDYGGRCEVPIGVTPGETITQAAQGRWRHLESSEEASHQFFVTLHGPGKDPLEVGSPFGPGRDSAAASRAGGARSNAATGMAPAGALGAEDFWQTFVVPDGYHGATIGPRNGLGGVYLWQEHGFWKGNLDTQAKRDAARDYGRATAGSARITIDTGPNESPYGWPLHEERLALGLRAATPEGTVVSNVRYTSGPTREGPWSQEQADPALVPGDRCYQIAWDMTTAAVPDAETPGVAGGSAYVAVRPLEPALLRPDRSQLPGGTFVTGHDSPSDRARADAMELDGDVFAPERTKSVSYLTKAVTAHVATEAAKRYLESLQADDELAIENPDLGGSGRVQIIRPGVAPVVDTSGTTAYVEGEERNVYGVCTFPNAQVVLEAPLVSP